VKRHRTDAEFKAMAAKARAQIEAARAAGILPPAESEDGR
jgi:hypothetical protein